MLLREGVARLLSDAGFEVVGQSATADELLSTVASCAPDVLLLSQHADVGLAMKLLAPSAEGVGYMLKDRVCDLDDFAEAVKRVAQGGSVLDPTIVSQLLGRRHTDDPLEDLSAREREVLELMAQGRSNQGIAERLGISERAVQKHVTSIFDSLGLPASSDDHRRVLAVLAFLRR
jgi:DNA-binding NarL/FixJ family response regulator